MPISAGQTVTRDFAVTVSAVQLNQVVVTGSGQKTEVKRLGNTVAVIIPPANAPINDMSNLLTAREPGVSGLVSGGLSGKAPRSVFAATRRCRRPTNPSCLLTACVSTAAAASASAPGAADHRRVSTISIPIHH